MDNSAPIPTPQPQAYRPKTQPYRGYRQPSVPGSPYFEYCSLILHDIQRRKVTTVANNRPVPCSYPSPSIVINAHRPVVQ